MPDYDCIVIGAGSGGIGAALAAARHGANTMLLEKASDIGGNAVRGGVHVWEPVAGATGIPFDIYRRLQGMDEAVVITSLGRHVLWDNGAGALEFGTRQQQCLINTKQRGARPEICVVDRFQVADCCLSASFQPESITNPTGTSFMSHYCTRQPNFPVASLLEFGTRQPNFPGSEKLPDPDRTYADTLQRHGFRSMARDEQICRRLLHSVIFEPQPYACTVRRMLQDAGCQIRCNIAVLGARTTRGHVDCIELADGSSLRASIYIDCTGDAIVCEACGCEMMFGQEGQDRFNEPHAPPNPTGRINGASLIYRVTPVDNPAVEPLPDGIPSGCWWQAAFPSAAFTMYPCTDININMLPTLIGEELVRLGQRAAMEEARRRIRAHWHFLQSTFDEFRRLRMSWIAPDLGVREGPRVVTEYVLDENDLLTGLSGQSHPDCIAIADHAMDTHGHGGSRELPGPYGIPYRSLIPATYDNLLVACRGAGFSSIAASSCRLSRTMMQLGQAAGTAAAMAVRAGTAAPEISVERLRQILRDDHVQLQWPAPEKLRSHIGPRTV